MIHISDTLLSDAYKDAYGFRPRNVYPEFITIEFYNEEMERLQVLIDESIREESYRQKENEKLFEGIITKTMQIGSVDRKKALDWMLDAEEVDRENLIEVEHFLWMQGLSYQYLDKMLKEIFS